MIPTSETGTNCYQGWMFDNSVYPKTFTQRSEERLLIWKEAMFTRKCASPLRVSWQAYFRFWQMFAVSDRAAVKSKHLRDQSRWARWVRAPRDHWPPPDRSPSRTSSTRCPPRRARWTPAALRRRWGPAGAVRGNLWPPRTALYPDSFHNPSAHSVSLCLKYLTGEKKNK